MSSKVKKAVILAAGRGTRFLPYTKAMPKEMIAVVDRPSLELIVDEIIESGINDILFVISPEKQSIVKHFSADKVLENFLESRGKMKEKQLVENITKRAQFSFVYQEVATGSGAAVLLAEKFANGEPVAVLNGDDAMYSEGGEPVTKQLVDCYMKYNKTVLGVQTVTREAIVKYASCDVVESYGRNHLIKSVIEKPKTDDQIKSLLAPLGRYVISGDFYDYIRQTPIAANGELQFTDSLKLQAAQVGIMAYDFVGIRYDLGDKLGYMQACVEYALRHPEIGEKFKTYLKNFNIK
ncbi:MAG TPA: UTP--glucose-1-phosphate uridylyltransferase [Clostridia bacterium]|nr:UTP--glucose-1-phosphate uridylyltransferase [Clostridia bacterium]